MEFSYHPKFEKKALEIHEFASSLDLDVNLVIGGDGSLLVYKSTSKPNILISPKTSKGYYASARFEDYKEFLTSYKDNPVNKEYTVLNASINNTIINDSALNEIIIGSGIEQILHCNIEINNQKRKVDCTALMLYTSSGWNGYAKNFNALRLKNPVNMGVFGVAPMDKSFPIKGVETNKPVTVEVLNRHEMPKLIVDCKNITDYRPCTTSIKNINYKPYSLYNNSIVKIEFGKITIATIL